MDIKLEDYKPIRSRKDLEVGRRYDFVFGSATEPCFKTFILNRNVFNIFDNSFHTTEVLLNPEDNLEFFEVKAVQNNDVVKHFEKRRNSDNKVSSTTHKARLKRTEIFYYLEPKDWNLSEDEEIPFTSNNFIFNTHGSSLDAASMIIFLQQQLEN